MADTPNEAARGLVSCYAIDDGARVLLVDPLAVPREIEELAAAREPVVVLDLAVARARYTEPRGANRRARVHAIARRRLP